MLKLGLQSAMEYRANFLLSIVSAIFPMVIQIFMWTAIYKNNQHITIFGYTYVQMITYSILAAIISKLVATGVEWEVANDIRDGGLNKFIVQPISYFLYRICCFMGQKLMQLIIFIILLIIIFAAIKFNFSLEIVPLRVVFFIIAIILAMGLNLLIAFCVSIIAFWITEAWAMFMIINLLINVASGGVFPLDIFGGRVLQVLNLLPFKYIIYFPISIINGKIGYFEIIYGGVIQIGWLILLTIIARAVWNIGMKRYVAVGG